MTTLKSLREAYEKGTPGTWTVSSLDPRSIHSLPNYQGIAYLLRRPNDAETANASLIVAMHAALPALLDIAEAAKMEHAECEGLRRAGIKAHPCEVCAALAKLEQETTK